MSKCNLNPAITYLDIDINPDTLIFNDLPSSIDTTETITELELQAIVMDEFGAAIENIEIELGQRLVELKKDGKLLFLMPYLHFIDKNGENLIR